MNFLSIIAGIVKLFNVIAAWLHDRELVDTGKALQQGQQDADALKKIQDAVDAGNDDNSALDDELCIESKPHDD